MGMSASQARLIALTARMSDTEYEAQQINQQRLTISNKMNEVYSQMCDMDVPTPPSKIDFAKDVYTGKDFGGTGVTVKMNEQGKPTLYKKVTGSVLNRTKGAQNKAASADPKTYMAEKPVTKSSFEKYDTTNAQLKVVDQQIKAADWTKPWNKFGDSQDDTVSGTFIYYTSNGQYTKDEEVADPSHKAGTDKPYTENTKEFTNASLSDIDKFMTQDVKDIVENDSVLYKPQGDLQYSGTRELGSGEVFSANATYVYGNQEIDGSDIIEHNKAVDELSTKKFAVAEGNSYKMVSAEDILKNGSDTDDYFEITDTAGFERACKAQESGGGTVTSADGKKKGAAVEISTLKDNDDFNLAYQALKHSNPDLTDKDLEDTFFAVDYGDGTFAFVQKEDFKDGDGNVYVYEVTNGEYDENQGEIDPKDLIYDNKGNITGLDQGDGQKITLKTTQEYDEFAYDAAMASYTAKKAQYDKEQNQLNKQTSIYQRQDKQLELKLTRLDNERNALNTEIEAVKKVIQDAIDRGFKTFSG